MREFDVREHNFLNICLDKVDDYIRKERIKQNEFDFITSTFKLCTTHINIFQDDELAKKLEEKKHRLVIRFLSKFSFCL